MKRQNNLYSQIISIPAIKYMYDKRVKINTRNKIKIERFDYNYVSNITMIKNILESRNYKPGKYNIFIITEPKIRLIMSQNIIDKLINHVVSKYFLINVFDKILIDTNVATRKNKGTHYGMKKLIDYLKKNMHKELYILKFDVSKYFFNLDHEILKKLIRKKIKDKDVLKILDTIIDSTDKPYINREIERLKEIRINQILKGNSHEKEKLINDVKKLPIYKKGKGLPIGNMSSQALAILYLNELDHYIKEVLKVDFYERYMDDGILISDSKEKLDDYLEKITIIIKKYKLELNSKTKIYSITEGFEFLGFKYIRKNNKLIIKVKNQTKRNFKRKIKTLNKLYSEDKIEYSDLWQVQSSYLGHLSYGNCQNLVKKTMDNVISDINIGKFVKIDNGEVVYI